MIRQLVVVSACAAAWMAGAQEAPAPATSPPPASSEQKPKAAVVNIQELFREYFKTQDAQDAINVERARIQKQNNDLLQRIQAMDEALREARRKVQDPALAEEARKELEREIGLRFQDRELLEKERQQSVQARHQQLNQKMVARMSGILDEIREVIRDRADKAGFDYVFDIAGLNSSQVPFVLYAKDATDITPMILKELNKDAPAKE